MLGTVGRKSRLGSNAAFRPVSGIGRTGAGSRVICCWFTRGSSKPSHRGLPPSRPASGPVPNKHKDAGRRHKTDGLSKPTQPIHNQHHSSSSSSSSSKSSPRASSWPQRMATIQALMARVQEQLHGVGRLHSSNPAVKQKAEQNLELLMRLAEAEHRHITGNLEPEELQQLLEELQQQLDLQHQDLTSDDGSSTAAGTSGTTGDQAAAGSLSSSFDRSELLGSNEALKAAVERASAQLTNRQRELSAAAGSSSGSQQQQEQQQQQQAGQSGAGGRLAGGSSVAVVAAAQEAQQVADSQVPEAATEEQLVGELMEAQAQLQEAEQALLDSEALRMDYDLMCQQAFELSRKLSVSEIARAELELELEDAKARLAASADELTEHRELQMNYDKLCQDMYRLRMMLQQAQAYRQEVSDEAASATNKHKQDVNWLMDAHRRELHDAHLKNQELTQDSQKLRMKLLELEQQIWGDSGSGSGSSNSSANLAAVAEASAAQVASQQQEIMLLQEAAQQLTAEKQQLLKKLQDTQREQAVLLVELQQLREQQRQQQQQQAAAAEAVAAPEAASPAQPVVTGKEQELLQQLEQAELQRSALVQQVQELQQSLQQSREAAAAAAAVAKVEAAAPLAKASVDAAAAVEAVQQLQEARAEMVQLRGQLAVTRRELQEVSGRAAASEAALQQQAADYEARLAQLQSWYGKQAAVVAQLRKGKAPADGQIGFTNTNRFWVRQELLFDFLKHWVSRESLLNNQQGFLGLQVQPVPGVTPDGGVDVVVSSLWESIPAWEAWSKSDAGRQQHMPTGVYQYVPGKGEGFPEDFVPFRDYDQAVNAKY